MVQIDVQNEHMMYLLYYLMWLAHTVIHQNNFTTSNVLYLFCLTFDKNKNKKLWSGLLNYLFSMINLFLDLFCTMVCLKTWIKSVEQVRLSLLIVKMTLSWKRYRSSNRKYIYLNIFVYFRLNVAGISTIWTILLII